MSDDMVYLAILVAGRLKPLFAVGQSERGNFDRGLSPAYRSSYRAPGRHVVYLFSCPWAMTTFSPRSTRLDSHMQRTSIRSYLNGLR